MAQDLSGKTRQLTGVAFALTIDAPVAAYAGLHHESDADLLAAARRKDAKAFGALVAKYHTLVYRIVWRMMNGHSEAEDIAQEAFLRLWKDPAQVRETGAVKAWLVRVAQNLVMDWLRHKPETGAELDDVGDGRPSAEQVLGQNWVGVRLNAVISKLPERQKMAVTLVHFGDFSQSEAAAAMDLSQDAFESLLMRARRAMKQELADDRQELLSALTEEG
jgi:RNA polymerase sigma-70 factor, ECF subfamily